MSELNKVNIKEVILFQSQVQGHLFGGKKKDPSSQNGHGEGVIMRQTQNKKQGPKLSGE